MRYYLETLGCPKNLVDAQGMERLLLRLGHRPVESARQADVLIVNTCGFVADAREESLGELHSVARKKRRGQILVATGCLSQYWGEALVEQVPGIDALLGTRRWTEIGTLLEELASQRGRQAGPPALLGDTVLGASLGEAAWGRQGASAYLKVADGCSAPCAFCAIPRIKGPAASRSPEAVVADAVELVQQGVKEITLIAQDTTAYGRDRGERDALPDLVEAIVDAAPDLRWLRLMYAYPGHVSPGLIERMASEERVCHYLDLPLQHAHPDVLRRMKRPADAHRIRRLVGDLRAAMPDLALRSTFIVGYPGETDAEFEALLSLVREVRFDRLGVFCYSAEAGTPAAALPGPVPQEVKEERRDRLMREQQPISTELNRSQVGRRLDVLVEGEGDGLLVGRTYRDAPEIDGLAFLTGEARVGDMVPARITGAMEYDLVAEVEHGGPLAALPGRL